ncbi:tRNA 5-methylaminomethyl-2-thiouridine synthase (plasmid) [Bradyrhizobium lupini]|uniref:tRNA 5-methylaminomethyl-2-thiouridine synthase n=1 Tax=Rhizobium lupini TaxID=136996 RepID=UPI003670C319
MGELLKSDEAAWEAALRLARDVEHGLRPGESWTLRIECENRPVFILSMTTKRC